MSKSNIQIAYDVLMESMEGMAKDAKGWKVTDISAVRNMTSAIVELKAENQALRDELAAVKGLSNEWVSDHTVRSGSIWQHRNGCKYEVITIANNETKTARYPVTVVYKNIDDGSIWSRPLSDWHMSMLPLPPSEAKS